MEQIMMILWTKHYTSRNTQFGVKVIMTCVVVTLECTSTGNAREYDMYMYPELKAKDFQVSNFSKCSAKIKC